MIGILIAGFILVGLSILLIAFATFMFTYNEESFWISFALVFKMVLGVGGLLILYWVFWDIVFYFT